MGMFQSYWLKDLFVDTSPATDAGRPGLSLSGRLDDSPIMVAFATQTGAAEGIAEGTLEQLQMAGRDVQMVDFYDISLSVLQQTRQALFVVSTTFDGDPPDMAEAFCDEAMGRPAELTHLRYSLLALGDRAYDTFCGFGHRLDAWLKASGARPWFEMLEVDDEDEQTIEHWHDGLSMLLTPS